MLDLYTFITYFVHACRLLLKRENYLAMMEFLKGLRSSYLYQKLVNDHAGELALQDPSLLRKHGELLELAREKVNENGYVFKKGKS